MYELVTFWRCDRSVFDLDDAIGEPEHAGIMRHNHNGSAALVGKIAHHLHHFASGVGVQRSSGLIGEDDARIPCQSSGNGDALLLTSTEIGGETFVFLSKADLIQ